MAKGYGGDPVRTQDELTEAGRTVPDSGRKGGAVGTADYNQEGPSAARAYDATAATSQKSGLGKLVPLIVFALFASLLVWAALAFRPGVSPAGEGRNAPAATRGEGTEQGNRTNQSGPGLDSGR